MELADGVVVNKADGDTRAAAERTRAQTTQSALHLLRPDEPPLAGPRPLLASAVNGGRHRRRSGRPRSRTGATTEALGASGELAERRRAQAREWLWSLVDAGPADEPFRRPIPGVAARADRARARPSRKRSG